MKNDFILRSHGLLRVEFVNKKTRMNKRKRENVRDNDRKEEEQTIELYYIDQHVCSSTNDRDVVRLEKTNAIYVQQFNLHIYQQKRKKEKNMYNI